MSTKDFDDPAQVRSMTATELSRMSAANAKAALKTLIGEQNPQFHHGAQGEPKLATAVSSQASDVTSVLLQLVIKITEVLTKNAELNEQLRELKDCNIRLTSRIEALEDQSSAQGPQRQDHMTATSSDVNALTSTVADELQERKEKELNLVIVGLAEGEEESEENPDAATKRKVDQLLQSLNVTHPKLTKVFRIGKKNQTRPRPIKVFCEDRNTRSTILSKGKDLNKLADSHPNKKVFIRPDLTKRQRDQDYQRRQGQRKEKETRLQNAGINQVT